MANNKIDVDGSPGGSSSASNGEHETDKSRRRQSSPVISVTGSADSLARGQRSRTISTPPSSSLLNQYQASTTQKRKGPMAPLKANKSDIDHEIDNLLRQIDPRGAEMATGFHTAPVSPPVTADSLAELNMPRIINNPKLRHDVNFDRELHFRPNLDGFKGKQKIEFAGLYWTALEGELVLCGFVQGQKQDADYGEREAYWQTVLTASLRRLPKVFKAVRDILNTLVPDEDQQAITDRLDVPLIMREISHGLCDLVDLANWLAKVLKNHCAPMRDELVDRMKKEIIRGASEQKPGKLVNGLRQLLNILEAMKLDVANHQIRHMRTILIENTIEFSRCYSAHRVKQGKILVLRAKHWIEDARWAIHMHDDYPDVAPTYVAGLAWGMLKALLYPDMQPMYPTTFYLDVERLRALRIDMQTTIYHQICKDVLTEFCGRRAPPQELAKALHALHFSVAAIVGPLCDFALNRDNIAAEIMRIGLQLEGRPHIDFDAVLLDRIEERLEIELQYYSIIYEHYADILFARLFPLLRARVEQGVRLSALQLQDRFVPQAHMPVMNAHTLSIGAVCTPGQRGLTADPDEDFLRRLTHILSLHWLIWADIAYLKSFEELEDEQPEEGTMPPPSPTVPVAQAVYAPGHKWLPVGITVTEVPSGYPTPTPTPRPQSKDKEDEEPEQEKSSFDSPGQPPQSA